MLFHLNIIITIIIIVIIIIARCSTTRTSSSRDGDHHHHCNYHHCQVLYHRIRYEEFQVINTLTDCAQPCEYNEYRLAIIVITIIIITMSTDWPS